MKTVEEIMNKHFKECFETHNETISEKYKLYFCKAMNEYAQQEREKAVSEFKDRLINELESLFNFHEEFTHQRMCATGAEYVRTKIIEKLK